MHAVQIKVLCNAQRLLTFDKAGYMSPGLDLRQHSNNKYVVLMLATELRLPNEPSRPTERGCGNKCVHECRAWPTGTNIPAKIVTWYAEGGSDLTLAKIIFEKTIYYREDTKIL